jgi:hypothetical protein
MVLKDPLVGHHENPRRRRNLLDLRDVQQVDLSMPCFDKLKTVWFLKIVSMKFMMIFMM